MESLNLKFLGWPYRIYIKTERMAACCENFPYEDDFAAHLAIFRSYCYSTKASEAAENIATVEKDYRKYSFCIIVWIARAYQQQ